LHTSSHNIFFIFLCITFFLAVIPIAICVIATLLVWKLYWSNTQDIAAPIDKAVDGEEVDEEAAKAEE